LTVLQPALSQPDKGKKSPKGKKGDAPAKLAKDALPLTKLPPAKLFPDLCVVKYRVTTSSPECQAFFDQGLGYLYSYVWMEAARSFETAAKHDPKCAMAWWGLSRAMEKWNKGHTEALKKAQELLPHASHRENMLITARLQEKGMIAGVTPDQRKKAAAKTLDELLVQYEDDDEAWFARAQLAENGVQAVPYYKALLKYNPLHAGAHHELVHFYESHRRPALGWPHALKYMESSPGMPHAFHMQAHLGMRVGRWDKTTDWSARAVELQRTYHKEMDVKPHQDWQFSHHLETLMKSLTHDGRFNEARALKKFCQEQKIVHTNPWFQLHLAARDWDEALKMADNHRKGDKLQASYWRALVYLAKGEPDRAAPEVAVLQEAYQGKRSDKQLEIRLWETQGWLQCAQGQADGGVKLLAKAVQKTKDDYRHHAWGGGAYYMETWGIAALQGGKYEVAEEAFLEALAHDTGSVRGALGMQVLCERLGRTEESIRFAELAARCWRKADAGRIQSELTALRVGLSQDTVRKTPNAGEGR
jgi:tetratricopeptide (TPR) repeat protein